MDIDLKAAGSEDWISTREMVECGGQGSSINDTLSQTYQRQRLPKPHHITLVLANGEPVISPITIPSFSVRLAMKNPLAWTSPPPFTL